jgi:hypothetical protein
MNDQISSLESFILCAHGNLDSSKIVSTRSQIHITTIENLSIIDH